MTEAMKLKVLGCSGGIGGAQPRTTSFLLDDDILIDCGTGVGDLTLDELARIDHVFLTHAHLDHIAALPLMIDSVGELRQAPVQVHATPETIRILHSHIFNWLVWPDFSAIPDHHQPFMRFQPIHVGERRNCATSSSRPPSPRSSTGSRWPRGTCARACRARSSTRSAVRPRSTSAT